MGFSPNPRGMINATGASPAFTAASAVSPVYSACSTPCFGAGLISRTATLLSAGPRPISARLAMVLVDNERPTFGVVSRRPPKITAKIEKNATGRMKLSARAPRSRRRAIKAVRTMERINRVTPFPSIAGIRIPDWACATIRPRVHVQRWPWRRAIRQFRSHAQS